MEKIINLIPASSADDILCKDGEVENSQQFFPDTTDSDSSDSGSSASSPIYSIEPAFLLPAGASFICMHTPSGEVRNAILRLRNGDIAYVRLDTGSSAQIPLVETARIPTPIKTVGVGDYLVFLTSVGLFYALWIKDEYRWIGETPPTPKAEIHASPRALPPYSYSDDSLPQFSVVADIGSDRSQDVLNWLNHGGASVSESTKINIRNAVKSAFSDYAEAVKRAGLHVSSVNARVCWQLPDETLWKAGEEVAVGDPEEPGLTILNASCADSRLYMTMQVDRAPFEVTMTPSTTTYPGLTPYLLVADETADSPYPPVHDDINSSGIPDAIFSIGRRLLAVFNRSGSQTANLIATSTVGLPMVSAGVASVAGEEIIHLTQSLRPLSSGQFGEFPLFAFCRDGIRALTPSEGSFRDVQLISRDVPLGPDSFAPLPDATCFLSEGGVMKIEGTNVSCLSKNMERHFTADDRLLYHYATDSLLLYRPRLMQAMRYSFATGRWSDVDIALSAHHYAWPSAVVVTDGMVGMLTTIVPMPFAVTTAEAPMPLKTRPIKLGNPFALKKVEEVEAAWPDGQQLPLRLYGALKPGKWYFLGLARRGRMRLRGSGWRYFRVETFASAGNLPTLRFIFS